MKRAWVLTSLLFSYLTAACQETKLETSTASSTGSDQKELPKSADEKVVPPVSVNGVYLNAHVLKEKSNNNNAEVTVGIASFYNGVKIADQRDRFQVTLKATPNANNGAIMTTEAVANGDYDHIVTVQGPSLERIRSAYATIGVYITVYDRNDNTTDTWSTPLDAVLSDSPAKTSVSSSSSSSASASSTTP
jgi:hypothetical protein